MPMGKHEGTLQTKVNCVYRLGYINEYIIFREPPVSTFYLTQKVEGDMEGKSWSNMGKSRKLRVTGDL